jgi:segregation and condensation protein B
MTVEIDSNSEVAVELEALIESLLFVANHAVTAAQLAQALKAEKADVEEALAALEASYASDGRGLRIQRKGERVQLVTAPEAGPHIQRFLGLELSGPLSQAALEALAIVAYKQPVTRAQVEAIRGVNSDSVLRTLVGRELIEEVGRLDQVGRPILYGTTFEFLRQFGLGSLEELPALEQEEPSNP